MRRGLYLRRERRIQRVNRILKEGYSNHIELLVQERLPSYRCQIVAVYKKPGAKEWD